MSSTIQRDKIKALVQEVLSRFPESSSEKRDADPEHIIVNSLKERHEREFDRDESAKSLITEDDLRGLDHGSRLRIKRDSKFTPLARDIVLERGIELIIKEERIVGTKVKTIAIGADHGGFELKEKLKPFIENLGISIRDFGTHSTDPVDYPDIALAVGRAIAGSSADAGILIDGAGIGSAMAANKVNGVRAAACYSVKLAINAREHNGANVLTLGSSITSFDEAASIVEAFIAHDISEERHLRRVGKIVSIEREF
ncbi:RpiB/LacA/LacB family sugar-phosphate isomerase [Leptolyngbya sp. 7M]|uniref:RpiB/LacA/LacB family sugar-phosphate isomerase n=1 Tax=Leptolyngbya sp. 7M TaxID=2812896 RepID=UPI001B8BB398|nr:RpiB/LacA/LacB family sugar-phosphate isomerase [Leptolyngbya sp. 7M]QYO67326.1 RpiB/LacA/LacB family sugar-phosphate isomerase [Leptolyngbya sp. 7M]